MGPTPQRFDMAPTRISLHYDFRNPAPWREDWGVRYRALLDQIAWAESALGFDAFSIPEHHLVDFASSPLTIAASVAARTSHAQIRTNVLVLPVHHPLHVAEASLTLDAISGGRFDLGVGLGYREGEFLAFGTSLRERRSRMEEGLAILRKAFDGERFAFAGRHFEFTEIQVVPGPVRSGGPELWIGGLTPPGIDRAARLGAGYLCPGEQAIDPYLEARKRHGLDPGRILLMQNWLVDDDPERTFARVGQHLLYHYQQYREFGMSQIPLFERPEELLEAGMVRLLDAGAARREIARIGERQMVEALEIWAVFPGESVDSSSARLEYLASKVLRVPQARE